MSEQKRRDVPGALASEVDATDPECFFPRLTPELSRHRFAAAARPQFYEALPTPRSGVGLNELLDGSLTAALAEKARECEQGEEYEAEAPDKSSDCLLLPARLAAELVRDKH